MDINDLNRQYWFHDGCIKSFHLNMQNSCVEIELFVKRITRKKALGPLLEEHMEPCLLRLMFDDLIEVSLFDRFPAQGYYTEFITVNDSGKGIEVLFNVHDSSNYVYETANWIIKSRKIAWKEI